MTMTVAVRVLHGRCQTISNATTNKTWSVFSCKLVDAHGNYCGFESKSFGSQDSQKKAMEAVHKKFADGLAFRMSRITSVKAANPLWDFFSVMQIVEYEIKKNVPSVVMTPILASTGDDKISPQSIESKIRLQDLGSTGGPHSGHLCCPEGMHTAFKTIRQSSGVGAVVSRREWRQNCIDMVVVNAEASDV